MLDRINNKTLRLIPIFLIIIYFGVIDRISLINEESKTYFLSGFIALSALAVIILIKRKELKQNRVIILAISLIISYLIFAFSL